MTSEIRPTIAIIGAGLSGLTTCKSALECDLEPTVFEQRSMIGGGWSKQGFASEGMKTNISHYHCMFSDFKWKKGTPDFPNQKQFFEYLCDYADTFKIHPHVRLNSEVRKIFPFEKRWTVEWIHHHTSFSQTFDYVVVCTGIFSQTFIPKIPGIDTFSGTICHSKDFKKSDPFANRSVVIIGNAFSGCEIAAHLAQKANQVFHVFHQPLWILPRYLPLAHHVPADLIYYTRKANAYSSEIPQEQLNAEKTRWFKTICEQEKISPKLQITTPPSDPPFVCISDVYLQEVKHQHIQLIPGDIQEIKNKTVYFQDNRSLNADALIFCTGYRTVLPFFDKKILEILGYQPDDSLQPLLLHKAVFPPPSLSNLAFVGLYRGPFLGVIELQARWVCMAFSQKVPLPTEEEIKRGIQEELAIRNQRPRPQFPHGNYVGFCEDLAAQIGVVPDFCKLQQEDLNLHDKLWEGPFTTASYRLSGFGSHPELALQIINEVNARAESLSTESQK